MTANQAIDALLDDFSYLDDWEDRYRYVIELGKTLEPLDEADYSDANKVRGCVSQVWLKRETAPGLKGAPVLSFKGDSDAHIVKGLIAILLRMYSGRTPETILKTDAKSVFHRLGLDEHLSPQRSNGLYAMVERIRRDAADAASEAVAG